MNRRDEIRFYRARPTDLGYVMPPSDLLSEAWQSLVRKEARAYTTHRWRLGDLLHYGETRYGETYDLAKKETGLSYQTLADLKWVASKIEFSRRREKLSWSHHKEVAGLPSAEQDRLLDLAERSRWSRDELREQVAKLGTEVPAEPDHEPEPRSSVTVVIERRDIPVPKQIRIQQPVSAVPIGVPAQLRIMKGDTFDLVAKPSTEAALAGLERWQQQFGEVLAPVATELARQLREAIERQLKAENTKSTPEKQATRRGLH